MSYITLDYLPDLTVSEMFNSQKLTFLYSPTVSTGWDNRANVYGSEQYALGHHTYKFDAIAGATYDIFSTSYFDPYLLRIFDNLGNTIVANSESDDGAEINLGGVYYSQDILFGWIPPYTGTYYVSASWNQGSFYTYYSLSVYEDLDTIPKVGPILGTSGDDTLISSALDETLAGGSGNDSYFVNALNDIVIEAIGGGIDSVNSSASYYLYENIENLTLTGTAAFGVGNALDNTIQGNASENLLIAGLGNDTVRGGGSRDAIFGESGDDKLYGDTGIDYIVAGSGNDTIYGGNDADEMYGQAGNDALYGGDDFQTDILVGGEGNDTLDGGAAWDLMYGESGDDTYYVSQEVDWVFESPGEGYDTVYANSPNGYYLFDNVEQLILLGTTPFGVGNASDNIITGNAIGNVLLGGAGNDTLEGGGGIDILWGQGGSDTFVIKRGTGLDIIADFTPGADKLNLAAYGFADLTAARSQMVQVGSDISINLGQGDSVILLGVSLANLGGADFFLGGGGGG